MLTLLITTTPMTFSEIRSKLNKDLETSYTRNAILGRAYRMNQCVKRPEISPEIRAERRRAVQIAKSAKKKAERHAAKPWLAERAPKTNRAEERRRVLAMLNDSGVSRTSPSYRRQFPKLPEMSKSELRGMLADAMRNTAAMGVS
jgi:hypothetical protein